MNNWLRVFIAVIVFMHGVGHVLFLVPALGIANWGQSARSWLLTDLLGDGPARGIGAAVWLAVIAGYLAGLYGYFTHSGWWPQLLVGASAASALGLIVFWAGTSPVSALIFNLAIMVALQVFKWPPVSN